MAKYRWLIDAINSLEIGTETGNPWCIKHRCLVKYSIRKLRECRLFLTKKRGEEAKKLKNIATTHSPTVSASWLNDYYFYVTSNCMRRAARQFRWTKILSASCVNDYYFYVTSNCMRRAARQFRWTKILSASSVNDYYFYVTSNCMRRAAR